MPFCCVSPSEKELWPLTPHTAVFLPDESGFGHVTQDDSDMNPEKLTWPSCLPLASIFLIRSPRGSVGQSLAAGQGGPGPLPELCRLYILVVLFPPQQNSLRHPRPPIPAPFPSRKI